MKRNKTSNWFMILVLVLPLLVFGLVKLFEFHFQPLPYYGKSYQQQDSIHAYQVTPFKFTNQDGKEITGDFISDKIWVACYFFTTCPSICPKMIAGMGEVQERFKNEKGLRMVSFTVDPEHDTPRILNDYAHVKSIDTKQWSLVTGNKTELYRYARKELKLVATDGDGGPQDFIHSDRLVLIDKENHIRGYYDGTEQSEVKQLMHDIESLLTINN